MSEASVEVSTDEDVPEAAIEKQWCRHPCFGTKLLVAALAGKRKERDGKRHLHESGKVHCGLVDSVTNCFCGAMLIHCTPLSAVGTTPTVRTKRHFVRTVSEETKIELGTS